ncbi:MAG: hypothetical protein JNK58_06860 [Phycisphaerae bacterium]|nr:hypothetical protein [Phycisphaerae bacterium]
MNIHDVGVLVMQARERGESKIRMIDHSRNQDQINQLTETKQSESEKPQDA